MKINFKDLEEAYEDASYGIEEPNILLVSKDTLEWIRRYWPDEQKEEEPAPEPDYFAEWVNDIRTKRNRPANYDKRKFIEQRYGKSSRILARR